MVVKDKEAVTMELSLKARPYLLHSFPAVTAVADKGCMLRLLVSPRLSEGYIPLQQPPDLQWVQSQTQS